MKVLTPISSTINTLAANSLLYFFAVCLLQGCFHTLKVLTNLR